MFAVAGLPGWVTSLLIVGGLVFAVFGSSGRDRGWNVFSRVFSLGCLLTLASFYALGVWELMGG